MSTYKHKPFVYVAGPISKGMMRDNVRLGIFGADRVWEMGAIPFCPHTSHFWDMISPHGYEEWLDMDFEVISRCDALLRLPGESKGADREVAFAREQQIPVFHDEAALAEWLKTWGQVKAGAR